MFFSHHNNLHEMRKIKKNFPKFVFFKEKIIIFVSWKPLYSRQYIEQKSIYFFNSLKIKPL